MKDASNLISLNSPESEDTRAVERVREWRTDAVLDGEKMTNHCPQDVHSKNSIRNGHHLVSVLRIVLCIFYLSSY